MTLRFRNTLCKVIAITQTVGFIFCLISCIIASVNGTLILPELFIRMIAISDTNSIFANSFSSTLIALFHFMIFAIVVCIAISHSFEKTQCTEVVFFMLFAISCVLESSRVFVPLYGIYNTSTRGLAYITRMVIFARVMMPLSFFFAAVLGSRQERQYIERNVVIIMSVSLVFAMSVPLDSSAFMSYLILQFGYSHTFFIITFVLNLTTILAMSISIYKLPSRDAIYKLAGFILILLGYVVLGVCDSFALLILGMIFMDGGAYLYLSFLHKIYLWN